MDSGQPLRRFRNDHREFFAASSATKPGARNPCARLAVVLGPSSSQEDAMIDIRHAALVLALCASAGAVHAQTTIITEEPGARVVTRPAAIELTPAQRT